MGNYLDKLGVSELWSKVKERDEATLLAAQNDASSKYALASTVNNLQTTINTFLNAADTSQDAIDTLKEIQDYIKNHGTDASSMLQAIETLEGYFTSGVANTAEKLNSSAGSATQPVYFSGGKPVACTYTLGKSVPSNAVFTDTTYSVFGGATSSAAGTSGLVPAPAKANVFYPKFLLDSGSWGYATTGNVKASDDFTSSYPEYNGSIDDILTKLIQEINLKASSSHTHSVATTSANGFMSSEMVTKLNGIDTGATADSAITSDELAAILV